MPKRIDFETVKGKKANNPLEEALVQLRDNLHTQLEMYEVIAKCRKKYFDDLIKEGFTEQQAMEIVKTTQI